MQKRTSSSKWIFRIGAFSLGLLVLFLGVLSQGPDTDLKFRREVPSESSPERLNRFMSSVTRWPQWFYSLDQAKVSNAEGSSKIGKGSLIVLNIDPHKGERKRFQLKAEVTEYLPGQK